MRMTAACSPFLRMSECVADRGLKEQAPQVDTARPAGADEEE